jgi:hypothetical protein
MATKSTITPRHVLHPHLHAAGAAPRRRLTARSVVRPIRTVCAWCEGQNRPTAVLVDVPIDDRGLSHGICSACRTSLRSESWALVHAASGASADWR